MSENSQIPRFIVKRIDRTDKAFMSIGTHKISQAQYTPCILEKVSSSQASLCYLNKYVLCKVVKRAHLVSQARMAEQPGVLSLLEVLLMQLDSAH